ncbi:hypothetical protein H4R35_004513 [Dimargaris xerosporica]|nr:hypothetical protein H4R35_004513 [Dimargaris xerosporica]
MSSTTMHLVARAGMVLTQGDNPTVTFDKEWFLKTNTGMIAFAATFIIHASNAIVSTRLNFKHRAPSMFTVAMFQALTAVGCHISRTSDYFFSTNCIAKPYINIFCYWFSMALTLAVFSWRLAHAMPRFMNAGLVIGLALQTTKFVTVLIFTINMVFRKMTWRRGLYQDGGIHTFLGGIVCLVILVLVFKEIVLGSTPEIMMQTKWAIESWTLTKQLQRLHSERKEAAGHLSLTALASDISTSRSNGQRSNRRSESTALMSNVRSHATSKGSRHPAMSNFSSTPQSTIEIEIDRTTDDKDEKLATTS